MLGQRQELKGNIAAVGAYLHVIREARGLSGRDRHHGGDAGSDTARVKSDICEVVMPYPVLTNALDALLI